MNWLRHIWLYMRHILASGEMAKYTLECICHGLRQNVIHNMWLDQSTLILEHAKVWTFFILNNIVFNYTSNFINQMVSVKIWQSQTVL